MTESVAALEHLLALRYDPADYPALRDQAARWRRDRPLAGLRVLDATPAFTNTLAKHWALLAGGAQLWVGVAPGVPADPRVLGMLPDFGIRVLTVADRPAFDAVLDCGGRYRDVPSRFGYAELTRSGAAAYDGSDAPVVMVDSARVKVIETSLGTGDGFLRAMAQLGHGDLAGRCLAVFGAGKVGTGVAARAAAAGAHVTVIDPRVRSTRISGVAVVDLADARSVRSCIRSAWCVVSATGVPGALAAWAAELVHSDALIANMGLDDEFGPELPAERVLNAKVPLNFILAEPTHLRYLDATMALSNASVIELMAGRVGPGVHTPAPGLEAQILQSVGTGSIAEELELIAGTPA